MPKILRPFLAIITTGFFLNMASYGQTPPCSSLAEYGAQLDVVAKKSYETTNRVKSKISGQLRPVDRGTVHGFDRDYIHLDLPGASFEVFKHNNSSILKSIQTDGEQLLKLSAPEYLTYEQAKSFLQTSEKICTTVIDRAAKGLCSYRAGHIAHEVFQKFPNVPVIKVWLGGPMRGRDTAGRPQTDGIVESFHTAPAMPVKQRDGKISWMVLDTRHCGIGPQTVEEWVKTTHDKNAFSPKVKFSLSPVTRIGPSRRDETTDNFKDGKHDYFRDSLIRADHMQ